jgi:hypothetical protein
MLLTHTQTPDLRYGAAQRVVSMVTPKLAHKWDDVR